MNFLDNSEGLDQLSRRRYASQREFSEEDDLAATSTSQNPKSTNPNDIVYWTNHRVMEWLRSVDLSEYAPNLRGSGVHGALMVRLIPLHQ